MLQTSKLHWNIIFCLIICIGLIHYIKGVQGNGEISIYIRKCCLGGLKHARVHHTCEKYGNEVASIPPLWLGLCHSTYGVCCSREVEKQNCEMGRLAALEGSRCDEVHNSSAYADCCRACQVGLAVRASDKNCKDSLFSYFTDIESYRVCCNDGGVAKERNNAYSSDTDTETDTDTELEKTDKENQGGAEGEVDDGAIVLNDDDDICSKIPNLCAHICENTFSAYQCKCHPGFVLDDNNVTCTAVEKKRTAAGTDITETTSEQATHKKKTESKNQINDNDDVDVDDDDDEIDADADFGADDTSDVCPSGYEFDVQRKKCIDIDECIMKLHECNVRQYCHNTIGGYHCLSVKAKSCDDGYRFNVESDECEDYNECDDTPCETGYKCLNYPGGYECNKIGNYAPKCEEGYQLENGHCVAIHECKIGFYLDITTNKCVDINECSVNNHNCLSSQRCDNTIGSYVCTRIQSCGTGYTLNADNKVCDDDDECASGTHNCPQDYDCFNTKGSFRCYRRTTTTTTTTTTTSTTTTTPAPPAGSWSSWNRSAHGYANNSGQYPYISRQTYSRSEYSPSYLAGLPCTHGFTRNNLGACVDINECAVTRPCSAHQRCINTNGSYRCENLLQCPAGFKSKPDGSSCMDIDECETGEHNCAENQLCRNRLGGYICQCPPGHQLSRLANGSNRCVDVDECINEPGTPPVCHSNALCLNTIGSYYCECKPGFQKKSSDGADPQQNAHAPCYDVDECQEISGLCQQKCVNFWGGYRCTCNAGYEISADNRTCNDIDECKLHKNYNLCMGYCNNVPGSYECSCPRGYTMAADKNTCRDIDECEAGDVCTGRHDVCTNTRGAYKCTTINCPYGYINDPEQKNRCRQVSNYCEGDDCYQKPSAYTYNFITLVSKLIMPPEGRTIFTLRGPAWYDDIDFDLKILRIQAAPNIEKASEAHFDTYENHNQANLILKRALDGPQDVELELSMTVFTNGMPRGKSVAKIFIYVSQYSF